MLCPFKHFIATEAGSASNASTTNAATPNAATTNAATAVRSSRGWVTAYSQSSVRDGAEAQTQGNLPDTVWASITPLWTSGMWHQELHMPLDIETSSNSRGSLGG